METVFENNDLEVCYKCNLLFLILQIFYYSVIWIVNCKCTSNCTYF